MASRNGIELEFHHLGIPTDEMRPGERYSALYGMYTSDSLCRTMRVQWHRFDPESPLDPLVRTLPHVAFKVADLKPHIEGQEIIIPPFVVGDFRNVVFIRKYHTIFEYMHYLKDGWFDGGKPA